MNNQYVLDNKKLTKMICDCLEIESIQELKNLTKEQQIKFNDLIFWLETIMGLNEVAKQFETEVYKIDKMH